MLGLKKHSVACAFNLHALVAQSHSIGLAAKKKPTPTEVVFPTVQSYLTAYGKTSRWLRLAEIAVLGEGKPDTKTALATAITEIEGLDTSGTMCFL